jgi:hypothetical protein
VKAVLATGRLRTSYRKAALATVSLHLNNSLRARVTDKLYICRL